jgi:hypothetical protein
MAGSALIDALGSEKWKELLGRQLSGDPKERSAANRELQTAIDESHAGKSKDLWINHKDIPHLIQIAMTMEFPLPKGAFTSAEGQILDWFWKVQHPLIAPAIADFYANASLRAKMSALVVLTMQRTHEALTTLTQLIARNGFPEHMHPRFFWELNNCIEFVDLLLPQLLSHAGGQIGGIVNFINAVDTRGELKPSHLQAAREMVEQQAAAAYGKVKQMQETGSSRWRYEEAYLEVATPFGAYLDLLGLMPESSLETLHAATHLSDPRLLLIAAVALLKRGIEPPAAILDSVAKSHAERLELHRILRVMGRLDLFPKAFLAFESFAASHMASWLAYPAELGYEPSLLELQATVRGSTEEGERQWCLWRFADDSGKAYAGVSGPYELDPALESMTHADTFSNFTPWDEATPEQHLASVLETLSNWRISLSLR